MDASPQKSRQRYGLAGLFQRADRVAIPVLSRIMPVLAMDGLRSVVSGGVRSGTRTFTARLPSLALGALVGVSGVSRDQSGTVVSRESSPGASLLESFIGANTSMNPNVMAILNAVLGDLQNLMSGKPVVINIGPETVSVAGGNYSISESITVQKAS